MALALTHTASGFIRAVALALTGAGWRRVRTDTPMEAPTLREDAVMGGPVGSVTFVVLGEIRVTQDLSRQAGAVDSVRLVWTVPMALRVAIGGQDEPVEVAADIIEMALRVLASAPNVRRAAQALTLASGAVAVHMAGDWPHARIPLVLSATLTHDMRPERHAASVAD